ncbi:LPS-assembly protein LptD precursor [Variibacter gotjawalensis]|uniref:LPS-assembly protein LptD n=1 Tax=Variibacter gotjawalensis TaxID=1333996 RepID=A0A0S3PYD8_9BRAD|nr:LPS-assembly protein LptD [Variibacter gotjawalensis]NIK46798.1 LPS-assembly protein [Variibacter gotjawalensis]RZS48702.1 LPS-assembly protein [Variibacter gotjawalensis]BAT60961.1 LPS-assembly protein LptD precursor [Variibacter gotjawalensis]
MKAVVSAYQPAKKPRVRGVALLASAALVGGCLLSVPAYSQSSIIQSNQIPWVGVPAASAKPPPTASSRRIKDPNAQMFVNANELRYDNNGDTVSAVGNVQIHYDGSVLQADRVTYNQKTKRLYAEGNVRFQEQDGKVVTSDRLEMDDQFRNGFVDSLHVETFEKTRIAGSRADVKEDSQENRITVFQAGVYTACEPCKEDPKKPAKWQIKAKRIIHSETDKTIYYEDMQFEVMGVPIAYLPYFWTPDPTVKRKTGFLAPNMLGGSFIGVGAQAPVFFNLSDSYDITLTPGYLSKQGFLGMAEWRQRLVNGAYAVRASGIFQQDKETFLGTTGYRDFRGAVETRGDFRIATNWYAGWDASLFTDNSYAPQYQVTRQGQEAISQAYLFGRGENSYFDMRAIHFYGLSPIDVQKQLPVLHPLLDYKYTFAQPILGGELSYSVNAASLSRRQADFDPITQAARNNLGWSDGLNVCDSQDPASMLQKIKSNCLLRGIPGEYTRLSAEVMWRKSIVDSWGQIFTPFMFARGDVAALSINNDPGVSNFIRTGDQTLTRGMAGVGLDYRYPFISTHSWGTQIIEPRAQVIFRPNESSVGRFPNEDSQSLVFDDANLFSISKFSGYDRVEGGSRANVGITYTAQFNQGGYFNALFGQSYNLFGQNSYAVSDMVNAGNMSGLETNQSDYVARMTYQPNRYYALTSRFRWDEKTFDTKRMELEARMNFDRWSASLTYGQYDEQPIAGIVLPREGIMPSATVKITQNWTVNASALYSIDQSKLNMASFGVGYVDECVALNLRYTENFGYQGNILPNRTVMLQLTLRTLGGIGVSQVTGGLSGGSGF